MFVVDNVTVRDVQLGVVALDPFMQGESLFGKQCQPLHAGGKLTWQAMSFAM